MSLNRLFPLLMLLMSLQALGGQGMPMQKLKICVQASGIDHGEKLEEFFASRSIYLKTKVDRIHLLKFVEEYKKFPPMLAKELTKAGAWIHLIQGNEISDDPTWDSVKSTFDNRDWDKVPGGGGFPGFNPTRIVVNHLYSQHGSINLFLHEHAHTLDNIYSANLISQSRAWSALQTDDVKHFLTKVCGSFCVENLNEGVAEMFAFYHACQASRDYMTEKVPEVARFFKNLTSMKLFKKSQK